MLYSADIKQNLRLLTRLDKGALLCQGLLLAIGVLFIHHAGMDYGGTPPRRWMTQVVWIGVGLGIYVATALADYRKLGPYSVLVYAGGVVLLALTLVVGASVNGARCVIKFGDGLALQVSEVAKPAVLLFAAWLLSHPLLRYLSFPSELLWGAIAAPPILLVALEPDWGTALVYFPFTFAILFLNRLTWKGCCGLLVCAVLAAPLLLGQLKPYQKIRIFVFAREPLETILMRMEKGHPGVAASVRQWLDGQMEKLEKSGDAEDGSPVAKDEPKILVTPSPTTPPKSSQRAEVKREIDDWNAKQAFLAVSSGRLAGKGLGQGTMHTLGFLPRTVAPTDFIFAVIAEETGLMGSAAVLLLLLAVILLACRTAWRAQDGYGASVAVGAAVMYMTHVCINVGMSVGWAPIIGIPLPFVSYGGSFMVGLMAVAGLVQSVHIHTEPKSKEDAEGLDGQ
ncbi:MAG: FtsW/RodA/SpoVE family cell cycle protein [Victivallales bacterium]|nr:FtsW/RodA/SpoVE family cell cycle protein [Victivallales bacterium]